MYTEPLWGIPFNLYAPFASVYMLALGVSESSIGLIATVGLSLQMITSILSGPITDKLGRKRATFIFDTVSWSIPALIWAFAQDVTWFYAAAICNSMLRITMTSWTCLFIEDAPANKVVHFWTWVHIAGLLSGLVAPVAGLLIERFELIPTMRAFYFFTFVSMTAKFVILNVVCTETEQGLRRLDETRGVPLRTLVWELIRTIPRVLRTRGTFLAVVVLAMNAIYITIRGSFFAVLLQEGLGFSPGQIGYFPAIRSAVILLFFFFVIPRLHQERHIGTLVLGIIATAAGTVLLIVSPAGSLGYVALATLGEAVGAALLAPYIEAFVTAVIDPRERATVLAIVGTLVLAVASPFGWVAGLLSEQAKSLPFVLALGVLTIALTLLIVRNPERAAER